MWSKNKGKSDPQRFTGKTSVIAIGAELIGDMSFDGAVQVDGTLKGTLKANEGLVRISISGHVEGEIRAPHIIIDGSVLGDIFASNHLELGAQAKVKGSLHYGAIETAMGAQIEGQLCPMVEGQRPLGLPSKVQDSDEA